MIVSEEVLDQGRLDAVVTCPVCSSSDIVPIGKKLTIHPRATSYFSIFSCKKCGHWSTNPMPKQDYLLKLYGEGSLSVYGEGWQETVSDQLEAESSAEELGKHRWIVEAEEAGPPGNYLEIGPGNCAVMRQFEGMKWNCYGIEPGSWSKDRPGFYESIAQLPDVQFDVAVMNDVLEHVPDPCGMLTEVASVMKPGARLYSCFPNADSVRARVQRVNWRMVRPIGHLQYFSRRSASNMLKRSGFTTKRMQAYDLLAETGWGDIMRSLSRLRLKYARRMLSDVIKSATVATFGEGDQWRVVALRD